MEEEFWWAAYEGNVSRVRRIFKRNRNLDVNWKVSGTSDTALSSACEEGRATMMSLLLAHPDIDANSEDWWGSSPFLNACRGGRASCVRILLRDSRVRVDQLDQHGYSPLRCAADGGHLDVIKWWIASGREMDLGQPRNLKTNAIAAAVAASGRIVEGWLTPEEMEKKRKQYVRVIHLLERFKENPEETRHEVRAEVGWYEETAVHLFAVVVFASDGLLVPRRVTGDAPAATRFFRIATQLPLELQTILCFRAMGLTREIMHGEESEVAFKELSDRI